MAHLIIGHTTETTARIWVRGDKPGICSLVVDPAVGSIPQKALGEETDFTGVFHLEGLTPAKVYSVEASFSTEAERKATGRFQTFPKQPARQPSSFSFVLSSCNLSVVSINNFLARLLATVGAKTALASLDLPLQRWRAPRFIWLRRLARIALGFLLGLAGKWIAASTAIKQPGPPYIRSPFLKLSAIFDSWVIEITLDDDKSHPAVGDCVYVPGGASGVLACSATVEGEKKDGRTDSERKLTKCKLVLTAVKGTFNKDDRVCRQAQTASNGEKEPPSFALGRITSVLRGKEWYSPPSFFLHAGDQIYYDFPDVNRKPEKSEYRLAYREAWFYDVANRHLLSHWPQYMTLDDHEIADQFARDFCPPPETAVPDTYLGEATVAYREYVEAISPQENNTDTARKNSGPYWYCFDKGETRFFVLDTRTQRVNNISRAQMIDEGQMSGLLRWMSDYKDDLKFVVTSVPFVAEISDDGSEQTLRWYQDAAPQQRGAAAAAAGARGSTPRNDENDKWSATRFKKQRDEIIEYVASNNIQRLIFLAGDMHCCYHASMRIATKAKAPIGTEPKYASIIVHELAGGPVNQLQLANPAEFDRRCTGRTSKGFAYETVLDRFHSQVNAVIHLEVKYVEREQTKLPGRALTPEVEWNVIRTLTDNEAADWPVIDNRPEAATSSKRSRNADVSSPESVMNGRICFVETRKPNDLPRW